MSLAVDPEPVPLVTDTDGVVRVGTTRVTLDTVVAAFREGATAEEIAQQYPTLRLADVYSVIAYYLRYRTTVDTYFADRSRLGEGMRWENEGRSDPTGIRDRLLARGMWKDRDDLPDIEALRREFDEHDTPAADQ